MALATQCPHCHTTFRVAHDQLKLRSGLVRCGACKQVFNGIEHLLRLDEVAAPYGPEAPVPASDTQRPSAFTPPATPADTSSPIQEETTPAESAVQAAEPASESAPPAEPAPSAPLAPSDNEQDVDPLQRMTLIDFADPGEFQPSTHPMTESPPVGADAGEADPLAKAIDELQSRPMRGEKKAAPHKAGENEPQSDEIDDEPSFVKQGKRRQRISRALRLITSVGSLLLLLILLAQGMYLFRNQITASYPAAKPVLIESCKLLGCEVGLPARIDAVSLESSELQALQQDKNVFLLNALLRNHASTAQVWPNIELTLLDANEKPVARKVFTPRDYLPVSQNVAKGFDPKSEQPVKLYLEISGLKAAGYRVYLFYP
ncbi:DUF3426 domain-containing protein [Noviherbaspirillum massiliense]|uniref:DUF3426 domain-containing protein n=1 Tax=Noviherbaspirillum massiliense TaxID=1465823 RepID=UPI0002E09288|nr:DUF3426 domain-containing protein [Noviherbaspirillum massiliense]